MKNENMSEAQMISNASIPQNANRFIIKITGTAEIDRLLEFGKEYLVQVKTEVRSINKIPCDDGTFDYMTSLRQSHVDVVVGGNKITSKDRSKKSKKLRGALYYAWEDSKVDIDFESFYEIMMDKIILNLHEIISYLRNK